MWNFSKHFFNALLALSLSFSFLNSKSKNQPPETYLENTQDMPSTIIKNPLKGFTTFTLMPIYPAFSQELNNKIQKLIEIELKKYGTLHKAGLLVKTEHDEAIDLSVFNKGSLLTYQIENVISQDLPIVRASLNLQSSVTINKTQKEYSPYIWSRNCFISGNTDKNLESLVMDSFAKLLSTFMANYSAVNSQKPVFNLIIQ